MHRSLGLAVVAITFAAALVGGASLASAQDPPPPCKQGQLPENFATPSCTPQPDTTVTGRPGTTVSFTARVPSNRLECSGSEGPSRPNRVENGWCRNYLGSIRWSACRGPFTLEWDPAEGDPDAPEVTQGRNRYGVTGVEARGTRMSVDLLENDARPIHLTYIYVGQRTVEISGTPDPDSNTPVTRYTATCSVSGVARINVTPRSGTIYGHTVPTDVERNNPHTEGPDVWVVVTPMGKGAGYTDPQCLNCQVGSSTADRPVRVGDLPICPTLPPGEQPDHQCRVRG